MPTASAFDDTVVMDRDPAPEGVVEFAMPWRGVVKLPGGGPGGTRPTERSSSSCGPTAARCFALLDGEEPQAMLKEFSPDDPVTPCTTARLTELATNTLDTSFMRETELGHRGPPSGTVDLETGHPARSTATQGSGVDDELPRAPPVLGVPSE